MEQTLNNKTETLAPPEEILSEEQQQQIVTNELATIPEEERNEIIKVVKTDDIVLIDSHKKKIKSFKARFPAKKYAITEDLEYNQEVYEKALEQWREVKNFRTKTAEPQFKSLKAPYVALTKFYNEATNPILADYKAIEKPISDFVDKLEALKKEAAEKEKKEFEQKINNRVDTLIKSGAVFNDGFYEAGSVEFNIPIISLGMVDIQSATDQIFDNILAQVKQTNELVAKAKEKYEADQLELKLKKEKEEAEAKQKIIEDQKRIDDQQKELAEKEEKIKERIFNTRSRELKSFGFELDSNGIVFRHQSGLSYGLSTIKNFNDEQWDGLITNIEDKIKELEEKAKKKAVFDARVKDLVDLGMIINLPETRYMTEGLTIEIATIPEYDDQKWADLITSTKIWIDNKKKEKEKRIADKAIADKKAEEELAEKERLEELNKQSDAVKFEEIKQQLFRIIYPPMTSNEYMVKVEKIKSFIYSL